MRSVALLLCTYAAAQEGNLIIHKVVESSTPEFDHVFASGQNFTVSLQVHNVGQGSAYGVSVKDHWPEQTSSGTDAFKLAGGSFEASWTEIAAGSKKIHNFSIVPLFEGRFDGSRAQGQYQSNPDGEVRTVVSTSMRPMSVLGAASYAKTFSKRYGEWFVFYLGVVIAVFAPLFVWGTIQRSNTPAPVKTSSKIGRAHV